MITHEDKNFLPPNAPKLRAESFLIDSKDNLIFSDG